MKALSTAAYRVAITCVSASQGTRSSAKHKCTKLKQMMMALFQVYPRALSLEMMPAWCPNIYEQCNGRHGVVAPKRVLFKLNELFFFCHII